MTEECSPALATPRRDAALDIAVAALWRAHKVLDATYGLSSIGFVPIGKKERADIERALADIDDPARGRITKWEKF